MPSARRAGQRPERQSRRRLARTENHERHSEPDQCERDVGDGELLDVQVQHARADVDYDGREQIAASHEEASIACFALYFSSRFVGSQRSWRAVFMIE